MIGSDGIPPARSRVPALGNLPACWATTAATWACSARDRGLEDDRLTARNFGLAGRGTVAVGKQADLVLFDAGRVKDAATYEEPTRPAEGIHTVIVNGGVAWEGGRSTGVRRGRVLRRTPPTAGVDA
jgi:N-acyl-D-amino-acid deacylase